MNNGKIYLVGAGPGDAGLITVRGRELIERADVIVYDRLVSKRLLDAAKGDAELVYAGKRPGGCAMKQDDINALLVSRARGGATVVRLKGGDPFVFARGGEEALFAAAAGVSFEIIPGVTAATAAAACAGIPLTHRNIASEITLVAGHERETTGKGESRLDWASLAQRPGTLAFYMGLGNIERICGRLIAGGMDEETPAAAIRWAGTPQQRTVTGTVKTLPAIVRGADIQPPAIVIVGRVVALRQRLRWFEKRPLFGLRVVVTRPREQAAPLADKLTLLGAKVILLPAIRIERPGDSSSLREAVGQIGQYDWLVLTSVNGVDAFFEALRQVGLDARSLAGARICVVGPATAERLERFSLRPDAQPAGALSAEIVPAMESIGPLDGARVLWPHADIAPENLATALRAKGALVDAPIAYRTVLETCDASEARRLVAAGEADWITFTSASAVRNFFALVSPSTVARRRVKLASIGPATSAALVELGLSPRAEAKTHSIDGLLDAIMESAANG